MKKIRLILEDDEENLAVGLVRLIQSMPDYEFFFHINKINNTEFRRVKDMEKRGVYYDYYHTCFEAYIKEAKANYLFISNKSIKSNRIKQIRELFVEEEEVNYLLPEYKDVDFILKISDGFDDFSLILSLENLAFSIQNFQLSSDEELYQLIQYYE
ncbi:MAG: IPExxxVDY family protein [Bergeyella zoohelcum]|nr:IPExxxVDY family protein [Bergeyella zoohelcum]